MPNDYFQFKQFLVWQQKAAMKVTTDSCLFGAWVAAQLSALNAEKDYRGLDIGTGTGLLSMMLVQADQGLQMDAVEIEENAAEQAIENINNSPWKERIKVIQADVLKFEVKNEYSLIISNPPFYENSLNSPSDTKNIAHHDGGLRLGELVSITSKMLAPGGRFHYLLPSSRSNEIMELLSANRLMAERICRVKQTPSHDHFRIMVTGSRDRLSTTEKIEEELSIRDSTGEYSPEFIRLLKDYYLHL